MWRDSRWFEGCYIDIHKKFHCWSCGKDFIVGEKLLESCITGYPICPYCGGRNPECIAGTLEEQLEELADFMGRLAIYIDEQCSGIDKRKYAFSELKRVFGNICSDEEINAVLEVYGTDLSFIAKLIKNKADEIDKNRNID